MANRYLSICDRRRRALTKPVYDVDRHGDDDDDDDDNRHDDTHGARCRVT